MTWTVGRAGRSGGVYVPPVLPVARFAGDPGIGKFYAGWCDGPKAEGALSNGMALTDAPLSVYHTYASGDGIGNVSTSQLNAAISNNMIPSQSFKLASWTPAQITAGSADAAIDTAADRCLAVAPWPVWLCYFHEPSDNFTTSQATTEYRAAWRYIVARFRAKGVTNVAWQTIMKSPFDFLHTGAGMAGDGDGVADGAPSGGSNIDWRWWDPDWKGTNTKTAADWYTGSEAVIDLLGLDQYVPITPSGTYPYTYQQMLDYSLSDMVGCARPMKPITHPEFGMGYQASPRPNWLTYCQAAVTYAQSKNVVAIQYWNHSQERAFEKDFNATGDPDGTKLLGWNHIANSAAVYVAGGA